MNQNNYLVRKRIGYIEAALLGNLIYIVLVLLFKKVFDLIGNTGEYNIILGIIFFVAMTAYLIGFNWLIFRNTTEKKGGYYNKYIICSMLPILVLTIVACVVITLSPGVSFGAAWSQFTFLVAPTLFWFLPYGLLFHFVGSYLPIIVFFVICFAYIIVLQLIGIGLGARNRARLRKREEKRSEADKITPEKIPAYSKTERAKRQKTVMVEEPAAPAAQPNPQRSAKPPVRKKADPKDPFGGDGDTTQIIYTEAFTAITDDMLAEARVQKRQNLDAKKVNKQTEANFSDAIDTDAVKRAIVESQRALDMDAKGGKKEAPEQSSPFSETKSDTQNISEELEQIRKRMTQRERKRRK